MSHATISTHRSPRRSRLWLLVSLLIATALVFSQGLKVALAFPIEFPPPPRDPPPVDDPTPPAFVPYLDGFDWAVPSRFGRDDNHDSMVDYHWDAAAMQYERGWIYPASWGMIFDGCRTAADAATGVSAANTYTWMLNGETISGNKCRFTYGKDSPNAGNLGFPAQGSYPVTLSVTYANPADSPTGVNPETFTKPVVVRDILIVSFGDSFASGEGNPDIPQTYHYNWWWPEKDTDPVWQDQRCHRSAKAGPAQAALAIESMDPKTSVTFLSYACAGGMIGTPIWDPIDYESIYDIFDHPAYLDPNRPRGVGVLGGYRGADVPKTFPYDFGQYIPPQITQLQQGLLPPSNQSRRQVDALIISAGGNDMHFADILLACVAHPNCSLEEDLIQEVPQPQYNVTKYSPREIIYRALGLAPGRENNTVPYYYDQLALTLRMFSPAPPAHVYVTQYPNLASNGTGENEGYCKMLDDILPPLEISPAEAKFGIVEGLGNLNNQLKLAVERHASENWTYVDGLATYVDGSPGLYHGHGYCAAENWINRAGESELRQGPLGNKAGTTGTAHPNYSGHQAYKKRLLHYMVPDLFPQPPANPPSIGEPVYAIGSLVDVPGAGGWYLGSCEAGTCHPKAVLQVVGMAEALVDGAGVTLNGANACTTAGVTCRTDGGLSADKKHYVWNIEVSAGGIYNFEFNLRDKTGAVANGGAAIKIDLQDPVLAAPGPFTVNEGTSVTLEASVQGTQDSPVSFTWDLDNNGIFETLEQKPVFSAADLYGPDSQMVRVTATDQAGRAATAQAVVNVLNTMPGVEITGVPESSPEGTLIQLGSSVSSPDPADALYYQWSATQGGTVVAGGTSPDFSFTPTDSGVCVVTLNVGDADGDETAVSATIIVTNVTPTPEITNVPQSSPEGTPINLGSSVSSPGPNDTFTYAWTLTRGGTQLDTGNDPDYAFIPVDNGEYLVSLSVTDQDGDVGSTTQTILVTNVAPAPTIHGAPANSPEGTAISLSGTVSDPGANDTTFTYLWTLSENGVELLTGVDPVFTFTPVDDASYQVSLTVTDKDSGTGQDSRTITVDNAAPTPEIKGVPDSNPEGTEIRLSSGVSDPGAGDSITSYAWSVTRNGSQFASGTAEDLSFTPLDNGSYEVSLSVTDDDGGTGTASQAIAVTNVEPVLSNISVTPGTIDEGGAVTLSGSISDAGSGDSFTLTVDWGDDSTSTSSLPAGSVDFSLSHTYADDNPTATPSDSINISVSLIDDDGGTVTGSASVVVNNLAPSLTLSAPANGTLYTVNTSVGLSGTYSDAGTQDTFSCTVNWDDGNTTAGTLTSGGCTASHAYRGAGVFTVQMTVADDDTGSTTKTVMVVVYDPSAGFVTGGGWINSPAGAYKADASLTGKATFGFVARYQKGAPVPTGNTAFQFQVAGFEFESTAYEWLVVNQAATNAQFKGSGLVNSADDPNGNAYKFMLWAGDGASANSADTFRIKIWYEAGGGEIVVYDNGVDQPIGGGNIVVHTKR